MLRDAEPMTQASLFLGSRNHPIRLGRAVQDRWALRTHRVGLWFVWINFRLPVHEFLVAAAFEPRLTSLFCGHCQVVAAEFAGIDICSAYIPLRSSHAEVGVRASRSRA